MAVFSVNQARQLYVANSAPTGIEPAALTESDMPGRGEVVYIQGDGSTPFYLFAGNARGEAIRSDIIEPGKVVSMSVTSAEKLIEPVKSYTITVDPDILSANGGNVPAGINYILSIHFKQWVSLGESERLDKVANVYTKTDMTPTNFYAALAKSIKRNFSKENKIYKLIDVTSSASGVVLTEVPQDWVLGKFSQQILHFDVSCNVVTINNVSTRWMAVAEATSTSYTDPVTGATINDGHKIADLEWFCMGERGDIYRQVGYPNNIDTRYLVDPDCAYDVIDIQYYYDGDAEDVQKSPKTMTIVVKRSE